MNRFQNLCLSTQFLSEEFGQHYLHAIVREEASLAVRNTLFCLIFFLTAGLLNVHVWLILVLIFNWLLHGTQANLTFDDIVLSNHHMDILQKNKEMAKCIIIWILV